MYGTIESQCHACRKTMVFEKKPGRRDECPHCGAEVHACLNCELYDPSLVRGCRETQAEEVREVARANFCNWFILRKGAAQNADPKAEAAKAKAGFDALFGKGAAPKEPGRDEAKAAFDALFKKK